MIDLLPSPWDEQFEQLVGCARRELLVASPYVGQDAMMRLVQCIRPSPGLSFRVHLLTNLAVSSLLDGATEPSALAYLMEAIPASRITVVPRLHAKVYVADATCAVVSSANLTVSGLERNYEYGVRLNEPGLVRSLKRHLSRYARLGNTLTRARLAAIRGTTEDMRASYAKAVSSARSTFRREFNERLDRATTEVLRAWAEGKTTNSIFSQAVLYLLERRGPLTTKELHPLVQATHPALCDDSVDRVIEGVHFGKLWKHYVRNAQQFLKRRGLIGRDDRQWHLASSPRGRLHQR
jgi:hypothetical protein